MPSRAFRARSSALVAAAGLVAAGCGSSHITLADLTGPSGTGVTITFNSTSTTADVASTSAATTATTTAAEVTTASWAPVTSNLTGVASECGSVSLVSARPSRDTVIAGVSLHGLWSSAKGSDTWTALGQGPGSATITNRASTIVYDPAHPDTFWESGIYNGGGVYRTDDDGASFKQLGDITHVDAVSVDLSDPARKTLLAGLHEQTGVMRSSDGGLTWTKVSTTLPAGVGFTSSPFVVDAQTYLLGTNHNDNSGVFRTTDGGATWTQVFKGAVIGQPLRTTADSLFWVVDGGGGIITSADGGITWTTAARSGTVDAAAPFLVELPAGAVAAVGNLAVIVSSDGGASWQKVGPTMPYRPAGLAYAPWRHAFYIWYFTCNRPGDNALPADSIMQLDVSGG